MKTQLYIVVNAEGACGSVCAGSVWTVGSWTACARWQLANGRRGDTEIIAF